MIWKMWRSHDEDHAQEYLDEDDGHGVEIEYDEHI